MVLYKYVHVYVSLCKYETSSSYLTNTIGIQVIKTLIMTLACYCFVFLLLFFVFVFWQFNCLVNWYSKILQERVKSIIKLLFDSSVIV